MRVQSLFKEQLLEFVEWREEPFDVEFLRTSCNDRFVDDASFQNALWTLENEGKIIRLNHHYLSTQVLKNRWIKGAASPTISLNHQEWFHDVSLPQSLLNQIQEFLSERLELGYLDVSEFVRDAVRRYIQQLKKAKGND